VSGIQAILAAIFLFFTIQKLGNLSNFHVMAWIKVQNLNGLWSGFHVPVQPKIDHLKTGLVQYSDVHCTSL
jgi:hypothetical protein